MSFTLVYLPASPKIESRHVADTYYDLGILQNIEQSIERKEECK